MEDFMLDEFDYDDHEEVFEKMLDDQFIDSLEPEFTDEDYFDPDEVAANVSSEWENSRERLY